MPAAEAQTRRPRILFVAEAVTLAHVARPYALASSLDKHRFEIHFAHDPRYRDLLGESAFSEHALHSIAPRQFLAALAAGRPLYDLATLSAYVEEDLALLAAVHPDIVVGDFRLSLAVSAAIAGITYVALSNAYWSPFCRQSYTVPDLPIARLLGSGLAQPLFSLVRPLAFALHCLPMHRLRRRYGLPSLGADLRSVYTHGDYTLYADIPQCFSMREHPSRHRFIGPVSWSPDSPVPDWWAQLPRTQPIIYVTLGSSGPAELLPGLVAALGSLGMTAVVSTAGAPFPEYVPANVYLADYLPGDEAVKIASLVVCNGGSPGTHQALLAGVPVIGVASNLDQYLNMAAIERAGAGRCLRAGTCNPRRLTAVIEEMVAEPGWQVSAQALGASLRAYRAPERFLRTIDEILAGPAP